MLTTTEFEVPVVARPAEDTKATKEQIHGSFWNVSGENETTFTFQTIDEATDSRWLRRSIIKK